MSLGSVFLHKQKSRERFAVCLMHKIKKREDLWKLVCR